MSTYRPTPVLCEHARERCAEMGISTKVAKRIVREAAVVRPGMAHSDRLVARLRKRIEWIAPVTVYPGEDELQALAEGVFRVLNGEEQARRLEPHPAAASGREALVIGLE